MSRQPWIGVDLDGTIAKYDQWVDEYHIGEPVPLMLERVKKMLAKGKKVKIFTARVSVPDKEIRAKIIDAIEKWCMAHLGQRLEVTCCKDYGMVELWDDRCIQVEKNTGQVVR